VLWPTLTPRVPFFFISRLLPSYLSDPLLHSLEIAFKEARQTLGPLNSYFHLRKKEKDERKQQKQQRIEEKLERDIRYDLGNAFVGFFIDLLGNYKDFIRPVNEGNHTHTHTHTRTHNSHVDCRRNQGGQLRSRGFRGGSA
jgi:hypothetical protein